MKFLVITHVVHKLVGTEVYAYGPYVKELNIWLRHCDAVRIVAPLNDSKTSPIDRLVNCYKMDFVIVPSISFTTIRKAVFGLFRLPSLLLKIFLEMTWADHIHVRCPGNMGLLACFVQILLPHKSKTFKYAGNWDPLSNQPMSFKLQRWILNNKWLTRNAKVIVYGDWPNSSVNIIPFFTASYSQLDITFTAIRNFDDEIKLVFIGTLSSGKRPMLAVQVAKMLTDLGFRVSFDFYGEGSERDRIERYIVENNLGHLVRIHGDVDEGSVKSALKIAHFLVFPSQSEGWPKVVAEAMFWGCVPITTSVSCVPYMLGNGTRGAVVAPDVGAMVSAIKLYLAEPDRYTESARAAMVWSRQFTLESFESEIVKLLKWEECCA